MLRLRTLGSRQLKIKAIANVNEVLIALTPGKILVEVVVKEMEPNQWHDEGR